MLIKIVYFVLRGCKFILIRRANKGARFGRNFNLDISTKIQAGNNRLVIGDNVYLRSNANGYHAGMPFSTTILIDKSGAECFIGDNSRVNGAYIHAQKRIQIGKNTVIAAGVNIIDSNGHNLNSKNRTQGRDCPSAIDIGDNVWIGLNSIILKGTSIGDNSVVAAGSVVKGKFPRNVLIQGNPAIIKRVLEIQFETSNTP